MSPSVNLATSEFKLSNPASTEPSYYNTAGDKPGTEEQVTYEEIGDARSNRVSLYDDVYLTPVDSDQGINEEPHYQPLNINDVVTYEIC